MLPDRRGDESVLPTPGPRRQTEIKLTQKCRQAVKPLNFGFVDGGIPSVPTEGYCGRVLQPSNVFVTSEPIVSRKGCFHAGPLHLDRGGNLLCPWQ